MTGFVYYHKNIFPLKDFCLPLENRAFLMADGICEVMVAFSQQILSLPFKYEKLKLSADLLKLDFPWSLEELQFPLTLILEKIKAPKIYIKVMIVRQGEQGLATISRSSDLIIIAKPCSQVDEELYQSGIKLSLAPSPFSSHPLKNLKPWDYRFASAHILQAREKGFNDILWHDSSGQILESSTANIIFLARQGNSYAFETPDGEVPIFQGTTREIVISLMKNAQIPIKENPIFVDELARFDEAFLCSTIRGLVPVARINQQTFASTRPNAAFWHIKSLFTTWLETQVGKRVNYVTGLIEESKRRDNEPLH